MRILYVAPGTPVPGTHGGSVHALSVCRALARRGHRVHLAARPGEPSGTAASAELDGDRQPAGEISMHPLPRILPARLLEWTSAPRIRRIARRVEPDVVIERFYTFGGGGLWAARSIGVPSVLEVNSPARPYPGSWRDRLDALTVVRPVDRWRRRQLQWAAGIYATGSELVPPWFDGPVAVVRNGVDARRFRPGPPASDEGRLRCVLVSSFRSWHGTEDAVAAVARCAERGVDLELTLVGEGPRLSAARAAARAAGVDGRVRFAGSVPHAEMPRLLQRMDVGVAPFDPEGFSALRLGWFWSPIKIFEYLAAGLPVVTIDIPELRDLLTDEVARFHPAGDTDALSRVLEELTADRQAVREMGAAARRLAEARYSWDHQAATVEDLLARVRGAPSPRGS